MAIEPDTAHATGHANAGAQDINAHVRDYSGFTRLFKWGAIAAFVIGAIVVLIISN
ncbi:MAG: aa3-type cytochrome c oxidase subunit IV [Sphingomicrobium sp.]